MCLFHIFVQTICDQYDIVPIMVGRLHSEHTRVFPILLADNKWITNNCSAKAFDNIRLNTADAKEPYRLRTFALLRLSPSE